MVKLLMKYSDIFKVHFLALQTRTRFQHEISKAVKIKQKKELWLQVAQDGSKECGVTVNDSVLQDEKSSGDGWW